jgi:hypothetical protein
MLIDPDMKPGGDFTPDLGLCDPGMRQQALAGHCQINGQDVDAFINLRHSDNLFSVQALPAFDFHVAGLEIFTLGDDIVDQHEHAAGRQQSGNTNDGVNYGCQATEKRQSAILFSAFADIFAWLLTFKHGSPQLIAMAVLK